MSLAGRAVHYMAETPITTKSCCGTLGLGPGPLCLSCQGLSNLLGVLCILKCRIIRSSISVVTRLGDVGRGLIVLDVGTP